MYLVVLFITTKHENVGYNYYEIFVVTGCFESEKHC